MTLIISLIFQLLLLLNTGKLSKADCISKGKIEIQLIIPDKLTQAVSYPCLAIDALIINRTDTVASFFEDWNSYGYYNIWFEVRFNDSTYILRKTPRDWPKNFPSFEVLFPGDTLKLSFNRKYFGCEFSQLSDMFKSNSTSSNSIKAIYQTHPEALEYAMKSSFFDSSRMVKYNYKWIPKDPKYPHANGDWVIRDSLETPVALYQTFPLSKIESIEYKIN